MMALPFVVLLAAALVAVLGFRRTSVIVWAVAAAATLYLLAIHATAPLKVAL
jgi:hypothetical protein